MQIFLLQLAGKDILSAVKGEMSGDLEDGFKALGMYQFILVQYA